MNNENIRKSGLVNNEISLPENDMVNATVMAEAFGKHPSDWLRLSSSKWFLTVLATTKNISQESLVLKIRKKDKQGRPEGIWMHEEVALEFSRWLSPSFAIWNNQHTRQLLLTGKTETTSSTEPLPALATGLLNTVGSSEDAIDEQTRKAIYHDAVLQSRTLISTTIIAKELGMSAQALNKWLHEKNILYKSDSHWLLYAHHQGKGYTGTKTALYIDSKGNYQSNIHTYWTEKGREFIHAILREAKQIA